MIIGDPQSSAFQFDSESQSAVMGDNVYSIGSIVECENGKERYQQVFAGVKQRLNRGESSCVIGCGCAMDMNGWTARLVYELLGECNGMTELTVKQMFEDGNGSVDVLAKKLPKPSMAGLTSFDDLTAVDCFNLKSIRIGNKRKNGKGLASSSSSSSSSSFSLSNLHDHLDLTEERRRKVRVELKGILNDGIQEIYDGQSGMRLGSGMNVIEVTMRSANDVFSQQHCQIVVAWASVVSTKVSRRLKGNSLDEHRRYAKRLNEGLCDLLGGGEGNDGDWLGMIKGYLDEDGTTLVCSIGYNHINTECVKMALRLADLMNQRGNGNGNGLSEQELDAIDMELFGGIGPSIIDCGGFKSGSDLFSQQDYIPQATSDKETTVQLSSADEQLIKANYNPMSSIKVSMAIRPLNSREIELNANADLGDMKVLGNEVHLQKHGFTFDEIIDHRAYTGNRSKRDWEKLNAAEASNLMNQLNYGFRSAIINHFGYPGAGINWSSLELLKAILKEAKKFQGDADHVFKSQIMEFGKTEKLYAGAPRKIELFKHVEHNVSDWFESGQEFASYEEYRQFLDDFYNSDDYQSLRTWNKELGTFDPTIGFQLISFPNVEGKIVFMTNGMGVTNSEPVACQNALLNIITKISEAINFNQKTLIPIRESRFTYFLRDFLWTKKTIYLIRGCIAPTDANADESLAMMRRLDGIKKIKSRANFERRWEEKQKEKGQPKSLVIVDREENEVSKSEQLNRISVLDTLISLQNPQSPCSIEWKQLKPQIMTRIVDDKCTKIMEEAIEKRNKQLEIGEEQKLELEQLASSTAYVESHKIKSVRKK